MTGNATIALLATLGVGYAGYRWIKWSEQSNAAFLRKKIRELIIAGVTNDLQEQKIVAKQLDRLLNGEDPETLQEILRIEWQIEPEGFGRANLSVFMYLREDESKLKMVESTYSFQRELLPFQIRQSFLIEANASQAYVLFDRNGAPKPPKPQT